MRSVDCSHLGRFCSPYRGDAGLFGINSGRSILRGALADWPSVVRRICASARRKIMMVLTDPDHCQCHLGRPQTDAERRVRSMQVDSRRAQAHLSRTDASVDCCHRSIHIIPKTNDLPHLRTASPLRRCVDGIRWLRHGNVAPPRQEAGALYVRPGLYAMGISRHQVAKCVQPKRT